MASFTSVGDITSLQMKHKGAVAAVALSGTYNMTIALQREQGSPGSGSWETLKSWDTADATVAYNWITERDNESLRLIVLVDTSGTCTATLTDSVDEVLRKEVDALGNVRFKMYEDGVVFFNSSGQVVADFRANSQIIEVADANYSILAANTGKTHVVNNVSADRTFTLPAVAKGLSFTFVAEVGGADGHDWIFAAAATSDLFTGGVLVVDTDAGPAVASAVVADQSDDDAFQINVPQGGTWVTIQSVDGVTWNVHGVVLATAVPAFS